MAEQERAISAEGSLSTKIDIEINRATQAETILQNNIDQEESNRKIAIETVEQAINAESERAEQAEANLLTDIQKEATDREAAINQEVADRNAAIDAAVAQEASIREKAISDEQLRAVRVEASLSQSITKEIADYVCDDVDHTGIYDAMKHYHLLHY